jgi:hypothetical protein
MARSPGAIRAGTRPPAAAMRAGRGFLGLADAPSLPPGTITGALNATLADILLAGTGTVAGGGGAPAAPTLSGKPLRWDVDFGAPAAGAMGTVASQAGSDSTMTATPGAGAPNIITMGNGRRAVDLNGSTQWVALNNAMGLLGIADAPFTLVIVAWRDTASLTQGVATLHRGTNSNATTIWQHGLLWTAANAQVWRRCDGSNNADATMGGAPSVSAPNIYVLRSNLSADTIARGMHNGGTKASSTAKAITATTAWAAGLGARFVSNVAQDFLDGKIERAFLYDGAATDAEMDTIQSALAAYYVA